MRNSWYWVLGLGAVFLDALALVVLQPLSVMTMDLGLMYRTGHVLSVTAISVLFSTLLSLSVVAGFWRPFSRLASLRRYRGWAELNLTCVVIALVLASFGVASVVLDFAFLDLEDIRHPIAHGPFWMMIINVVAPIPLLIFAAVSYVARRRSLKYADRSQ